MAAGDVTPGTRREDGTMPYDLEPGEYALSESGDVVWLRNPDGEGGSVNATIWTITVEDDGTVTVNPSIWWNKDATPPGWHGYLERGVWRQV